MIPTIENIVADLMSGRITQTQAINWLNQHAQPVESLRDVYAGLALQGLCASGGPYQPNDYIWWGIVICKVEDVAREAYKLADAMLQERAK